jgi:hypothetical protein
MAETLISGPEIISPGAASPDYLVTGAYTDSTINTIQGMSGVENVTQVYPESGVPEIIRFADRRRSSSWASLTASASGLSRTTAPSETTAARVGTAISVSTVASLCGATFAILPWLLVG